MPDEAERPEQGHSHEFLPSIGHLLNQPIRSGVCLDPAGTGNCDQERCQACRYFLAEEEGQ